MSNLNTQSLLLIVPHIEVFIEDQANLIRPYFNDMTVLMPMPYFSSIALKLPLVKRRFRFLQLSEKSNNKYQKNYTMVSPKYFTLPINVMQKRFGYLASTNSIKALNKKAAKFDLLHAHFLDQGYIGAKLKSLYNKPLVITAHGGEVYDLPFKSQWYNTLYRYVIGEADQVITVSNFNAEKLLSLGVPSKKIHVIPNGYNEAFFKALSVIAMRQKLELPLNKKILLSIGNLVPEKGHTFLIDAMRFVIQKHQDALLIIIGDGILREELERQVKHLGLSGKVLLLGRKSHEEIPMWINACDIFVAPSLTESFGVVIIEALACGKPVVGTRVGGIPEIISSCEVGILVESAHSSSLAEGLLEAMARKWSQMAITSYAEQYSWNQIVPKIIDVYYQALNNPACVHPNNIG
jgi:glycosyltransferase involved in cell wall biosynthesis